MFLVSWTNYDHVDEYSQITCWRFLARFYKYRNRTKNFFRLNHTLKYCRLSRRCVMKGLQSCCVFFCALQFSVFSSVVAPICWLAECCYNVYIKVLLLKHLDTFGASESKIRLDAGRFFLSFWLRFHFHSFASWFNAFWNNNNSDSIKCVNYAKWKKCNFSFAVIMRKHEIKMDRN